MWEKVKVEFKEQVWENEHVVKLRQRFAELDTQTQSYIIIGAFSIFVLLLLGSFVGLLAKTNSLKSDIAGLEESIQLSQGTSARIEELKAQARAQNNDPLLRDLDKTAPVVEFAEKAAQKSMIAKASTEVSELKANTASVKLNKISLRQLVRMLYLVEHSGANAVVDKLSVDSKDDPEGYLWADLIVRKN